MNKPVEILEVEKVIVERKQKIDELAQDAFILEKRLPLVMFEGDQQKIDELKSKIEKITQEIRDEELRVEGGKQKLKELVAKWIKDQEATEQKELETSELEAKEIQSKIEKHLAGIEKICGERPVFISTHTENSLAARRLMEQVNSTRRRLREGDVGKDIRKYMGM